MTETAKYRALLAFSAAATLAGLATLLPRAAASWPNLVGYRSLCTFAPAGTLFCFLAAGASCFVRATFVKDRDGTAGARLRRHAKSLVPLVLVLGAALWFTRSWVEIKSSYADAGTAATAQGDTP